MVQLEQFHDRLCGQLQKMRRNLKCLYCKRLLRDAVTSIPCGHSYCLGCKGGYERECCKCPGVKREAVYRNELLDEAIEASNLVETVIQQLQPKQ